MCVNHTLTFLDACQGNIEVRLQIYDSNNVSQAFDKLVKLGKFLRLRAFLLVHYVTWY